MQESAGRIGFGGLAAIPLEPEEKFFWQRGLAVAEGCGNLFVRGQEQILEGLGGNVFGLFRTVCVEQLRQIAKRGALFG